MKLYQTLPLESKICYNTLYVLSFPNCYIHQYFFPQNPYLLYKENVCYFNKGVNSLWIGLFYEVI